MKKINNRKTSYAQVISGVALTVFMFVTAGLTVARLMAEHIPVAQYTENIFGKYKLIGLNTRITEALSGGEYMESNEVLLGKDGWLFYKVMTDGTPLYDYMGINRFTDEELSSIYERISSENEEMAARGIKYACITIPNKEQVYDIYMPDTAERVSETSRLDQLTEYMEKRISESAGEAATLSVPYADVTDILMQYRDEYPLYYKTDTHYTDVGAYLTLKSIQKVLDGKTVDTTEENIAEDVDKEPDNVANYYGADTVSLDGLTFIKTPGFEGDLTRISATTDRFTDVSYPIDPSSIPEEDKSDESLLIIGDSFGDALQLVAQYYYREVNFVLCTDYDSAMLDMYNPDVVVRECVERYLPRLIP